jgi:hypothetical protein
MLGVLRARREVCPYCFDPFDLRETPFRCVNLKDKTAPGGCTKEVDSRLVEKWVDPRRTGRVVPPRQKRVVRETACDECGLVTRNRLCPHCHMELPAFIGQAKNLIFAVIGAKDAGKSHFLAVLIDQLRKHTGPRLNLLLEFVNENTNERYKNEFYRPLFEGRRTIEKTRSATEAANRPLMYYLSIDRPGIFGVRRTVVNLVFFDTAGEDLDALDTMSVVNKYIYRADGVILLLDPLQLERVRDRLGRAGLPEPSTETAEILTRTTTLIKQGRRLRATARIPSPLAIAFSKFDAVEPLIDPQFQLNATPAHDGGIDLADVTAVNDEMQALLREWDGAHLINTARMQYRKFCFFGLSALGAAPVGTRVVRVTPRRVDDPFLWLLHQHGLLSAAQRR